MLNKIIAWSLAHRPIVMVIAATVLIYGGMFDKADISVPATTHYAFCAMSLKIRVFGIGR